MRFMSATDGAERTIVSVRQPSCPPSLEAPEPGERFLGPSGLIWTVQAVTAGGDRIVLTTLTADGDSGVIVDLLAIARIIRVPNRSIVSGHALRHTGRRWPTLLSQRHRGRRPAGPGHPCSHRPEPVTATSVDHARAWHDPFPNAPPGRRRLADPSQRGRDAIEGGDMNFGMILRRSARSSITIGPATAWRRVATVSGQSRTLRHPPATESGS
jgi:hypothetical protein